MDLKRAFKESLSKPEPGDEVGLRPIRRDAVRVPLRDEWGEVTGEGTTLKLKNRRVIEKIAFSESRAAAARTVLDLKVTPAQCTQQHPELVGPYLAVHAAELVHGIAKRGHGGIHPAGCTAPLGTAQRQCQASRG